MRRFPRIIAVAYSGAETPYSSLKALRVGQAGGETTAELLGPPPSPRKYWSRQVLFEWLKDLALTGAPSLILLDHALSFPLRWFEVHGIEPDWDVFLDDFAIHWPSDEQYVYVDFIRDGHCGNAAARSGNPQWKRLPDEAAGIPSPLQFEGRAATGKATHAGLPWLHRLRRECGNKIHFWPFDGWTPMPGKTVVAETRASLFGLPAGRPDLVADCIRSLDHTDRMESLLHPALTPSMAGTAQLEGWILRTLKLP